MGEALLEEDDAASLHVRADIAGDELELFRLEKQTYPESTLLMDRLISRAEKAAAPEPTATTTTENVIKQETAIGGGAAK